MTKQEILDVIVKLPDDITEAEVIEELRLRQRHYQAIASLDAGKGIPHEEIEAMVDQWLQEEE